ncbi:MAG: hypothetical protein HOP18_26750 [Deltaproteobacteria bacterium]|nr:hypothetical protein [Deltaproteobacteria bacterium]
MSTTKNPPSRRALLQERIRALEAAEGQLQTMQPADADGQQRKAQLLRGIAEQKEVCRQELQLREAYIRATSKEQQARIWMKLRTLRARHPELYGSSRVADPCVPCRQSESRQMKEQNIRDHLVSGMKELNTSKCPGGGLRFKYRHNTTDNEYRMPPSHWQPTSADGKKPEQSRSMDYQLKPNVKPSEAIDSLFHGDDCPVVIECMTAIDLLYYRALLATLGPQKFDELFKDGIRIAPNKGPIQKYYTVECRPNRASLQKGDWVYFYNHPDYLNRHGQSLNRAFQGENAIVTGNNKYAGFGVLESSNARMRQELFDAYNLPPKKYDPVTKQYVYNQEADKKYPPLTDPDTIPGLTAPRGDCKGEVDPVVTPNMDEIP